jgi:hypothetical protein
VHLASILLPAGLSVCGVWAALHVFGEQGWVLFAALPFFQPFITSLILRSFEDASWLRCWGYSLLSILLICAGILLFSLDGLICLIMALPWALVGSLTGSTLGYFLGRRISPKVSGIIPILLAISYPGMLGFEQKFSPPPNIHEVTSSVVIDAPIEEVWKQVIAFDKIEEPPSGIFKMGIAYPIQARIEGEGVGAVRHCIFSTGPFVEPITVWDPPHRLEFDVTSNPPAMKELSPYGNIDTPHLHDTFVSQRGRFKLTAIDGKTHLEGTTWYSQKIKPDWYWHRISDEIIHEIHLRVLEQIKRQTES